jgi:hypothetical protein
MNRTLLVAVAVVSALALAQDHHEGAHQPGHAEEHRAPAPKWQAHPSGQHPHGPIVRQHPTRVLRPRVIERGHPVWHHWEHPGFVRPLYYWDWAQLRQITCIAEDSYGDQYPVTQNTFSGFGLDNMTEVEDAALDRCYEESGGDQSCFLATCSHF